MKMTESSQKPVGWGLGWADLLSPETEIGLYRSWQGVPRPETNWAPGWPTKALKFCIFLS